MIVNKTAKAAAASASLFSRKIAWCAREKQFGTKFLNEAVCSIFGGQKRWQQKSRAELRRKHENHNFLYLWRNATNLVIFHALTMCWSSNFSSFFNDPSFSLYFQKGFEWMEIGQNITILYVVCVERFDIIQYTTTSSLEKSVGCLHIPFHFAALTSYCCCRSPSIQFIIQRVRDNGRSRTGIFI